MDEIVVLSCESIMIAVHLIHSLVYSPPEDFDAFLCCQVFLHGTILISVHVGITFAQLAAHQIKLLRDVILQVCLDEVYLMVGLPKIRLKLLNDGLLQSLDIVVNFANLARPRPKIGLKHVDLVLHF